ncbi:tyrosine decarboxylase MfnA [Halopelagius longus]|uniref:Probable L-aspartate decarboxylase n=1 Tax=Halopelagius longus TaxID=1236180 RepID=A0A1H1D5G3_9EURY|nr:tyrosine decarboxylase MfnA [Halopelagius longus]RDI71168.1 tyrosine decarboxylase MfnA [Halopelagius longus]SDQ71459.1 tyrosine decarboxylase / aspartate 1-decarboxylase [Halopelagius longus]
MQRAAPQEFTRVLSSMCTEPHPAARDAAERFLATNPGDPATYRTVARLEERAVETLGEIAGLSEPHGYVTSGGTEANIQAVRSARNRRRVEDPNVVVPESAHFSFTKAADVLGVELRRVPTDEDHRADVSAVRAAADDDTVLVVGVAGSTEFGRVDPVPELADVAHEAGAFLHVDAAWGGFYLPFTDHEWGFADAPVDSMTIDPHKCGQAAVPAGGLLFRERAGLDALAVDTPYLESTSQATLTGTRSGAGVAAAAAAMDALWPDGYRREYERAAELASWFASELRERGFAVADVELPIVAASVPESLFERLREAGWRISRTESGELRVVCMPHVTREMLVAFLADIDERRPSPP